MTAPAAPRIDAHLHFWRYEPAEYAWIDDAMAGLRRDCLPEEARIDLQAMDARRQLELFADQPRLVGIRHIVQSEPDDRFMLRASFCRGIALLEEFGLAYDILGYSRHLPAAAELVARFPRQRFVLDHLGKPDIAHGGLRAWERDIRAVAACANVSAKVSGLVTEADWTAWTEQDVRPYLDVAFDCFGADRLMIGSDWPVCTVAADYARAMALVSRYLADRLPQERDAVLGGNAQRFYNLQVRTSAEAAQ
jgi:L-fuconolactonase